MRPPHYWRDRMRRYRRRLGRVLREKEAAYSAAYYRRHKARLDEQRRKRLGWTARSSWPVVRCGRCAGEWRSKSGQPKRCPHCWLRFRHHD